MGWPQWCVLGVVAFNLYMGAIQKGEPHVLHPFWYVFAYYAVLVFLLWLGGFWG